ncbi:MAG: sigma-70 family RNA polymerase sigma factor [Rhodospirillales bacterium]
MADTGERGRSCGCGSSTAVDEITDVFADLIERVAETGDLSSFEAIFRHYVPRLKAWGMRSGMNAAVAEELAQETMISLWRKARTFERSRASASRWVFAIFRNKRIDDLRRDRLRQTDLDRAADVADDGADPEASVHINATGRALQRAMRTLPEDQAVVLREVYFGCKSHRQVAAELNVPLGTVKSRVRLALARMRLAVGDQQPS